MTITLRELATGKPLGAGDVVYDRHGHGWRIDSWSPSADIVYLREPGKPHEALSAWGPAEVGCYIGHPLASAIQNTHALDKIKRVRAYNAKLDEEERSPTGDDYNALLRILGV